MCEFTTLFWLEQTARAEWSGKMGNTFNFFCVAGAVVVVVVLSPGSAKGVVHGKRSPIQPQDKFSDKQLMELEKNIFL